MCVRVVSVMCDLCSVGTRCPHCTRFCVIQSRHGRMCAFLGVNEASPIQGRCIVSPRTAGDGQMIVWICIVSRYSVMCTGGVIIVCVCPGDSGLVCV